MMKKFEGGYYFAILELLKDLKRKNKNRKSYHGKQLFNLFEDKFGSGNYLNFLKALKQLKKSDRISIKKVKHYNRRYYSLKS